MPFTQVHRLLVFVKLPIPGGVKTRLAAEVGPEKAAALYRAWVPPYIRSLQALGKDVSIAVALAPPTPTERDLTGNALDLAKEWISDPVDWSWQIGSDLGQRLQKAIREERRKGWDSVLVLGSDSPQLSLQTLRKNLALLDSHDLVLGPAEDGGYYSVGLGRDPEDLFERVRWSSPETLEDTLREAERKGWSVGLGPSEYDIDTFDDLNRLIAEDGRWSFLERLIEG